MQLADADEWDRIFGELPAELREPYFHPGWCAAAQSWERALPGPAYLVAGLADRTFLYPHLCHALPFSPGCDAQTPYGYGGPLFAGEWSADDKRTALIDLAGALRARGAIAEFVRCHPEWCDAGTLAAAGYTTFQVRTNVECDLTGDDFTATWVASARRNLRKAQSSGLTFRVASSPHLPTPSSPCPVDLDTFCRLYAATADRLAMAPHYRFDRAYAQAVLATPGAAMVIVEAPGPTPVAAAILLLGGRLAYYHLGASDFAHQHLRPNDFLYHAMAAVARDHGCARITWGGGMSNDPDDSLFRFKTHFGAIRTPVYCAGRVLDRAAFDAQVDAWAAANPGREARMFLKYRA